jgi:hypothetical protein
MSPQSAWRILQAEGARLRLEEGPLIESVFDAGEEPPDIVAPALVMVEADGTYIKRSVRTPTASRSRPASSTAARSAREAGAIAAGCSWTRAAMPPPPTPTRSTKPLLRKASGPSDYITPGGCCVPRWARRVRADLQGLVPGCCPPGRPLPRRGAPVAALLRELGVLSKTQESNRREPSCSRHRLRRGLLGDDEDRAIELASYLDTVVDHLHGIDRLPRRLRRGAHARRRHRRSREAPRPRRGTTHEATRHALNPTRRRQPAGSSSAQVL